MKTKMKLSYFLLSASAWVNAVHATLNITELLTDTPKCAFNCVLSGLTQYNCSLATFDTCLCPNIAFQSDLSTCVQKSCTFEDQVQAVNVENGVCAGTPKESRSSEVRRDAIILSAITYPIVGLRCFARYSVTHKLWVDDYCALIATFFLVALGGIEITSASMGFGDHYWNVSVSNGTILLKLFYVVQIAYVLVQVFAKVSILILYFRVFPRPWFKITCKIFIAFLLCHGLAYIMVIILQCSPISSIWDRNITGTCVNLEVVAYSGAIFSIVEDLLILVLPISELNTLSFAISKRVSLMLMFGIGSFACVTSMIRLKYVLAFQNSYDSTWENVDVVIWSMIEEHTAVICCCLPSLRPLLVQWIPGVFKSMTTKNNTIGSGSYRMGPWKPTIRKNETYSGLGNSNLEVEHFRHDSMAKIIHPMDRAIKGSGSDEENSPTDWTSHPEKDVKIMTDQSQVHQDMSWVQIPRSGNEKDSAQRLR